MLAVLNILALAAVAGFFLALHVACYGLGALGIERMLAAYEPAGWVVVTIGITLEVGKAGLAYGTAQLLHVRAYGSALVMGLLGLPPVRTALSDLGP